MTVRYIPAALCVSMEKVDEIVKNLNDENEIPLELIVMIDYAYHCNDHDYDGGLSFIDRLHYVLKVFFELDWTRESLKELAMQNPDEFLTVLRQHITNDMVQVYGV